MVHFGRDGLQEHAGAVSGCVGQRRVREKDSCAKGLLSGEDVPDERSKDAEPVRAIVKTEDFEG